MADVDEKVPGANRFQRAVRRESIVVDKGALVKVGSLESGKACPLLVQPRIFDIHLPEWAKENLNWIETRLAQHGAILFRGFQTTEEIFKEFGRAITGELVNYIEGSSPRVMLGDKLYTSTEYPPEYFISLHNELSYTHRWPGKIMFYCAVAPQQGGETPIADSREVFRQIDPAVKRQFVKKGVKYVRNLHGGIGAGLSWQTVFETNDRLVVEAYCLEGGIEFHWKDNGGLWTGQVRPGVILHPRTGDTVWFNQVDQWHPSSLEPGVSDALLATTPEEELPINAYYGDGSPFELSALSNVREAYRRAMSTFPWHVGDILLLDNMLFAHGRMPFVGPRRILVLMGDTIRLSQVQRAEAEA